MSKWIPDRKVWGGGLAAIAAFFIGAALGVPPEALTPAVAGVYGLAAYLLPPSFADLVRRVDDLLVAAGVDPDDLVDDEPDASTGKP